MVSYNFNSNKKTITAEKKTMFRLYLILFKTTTSYISARTIYKHYLSFFKSRKKVYIVIAQYYEQSSLNPTDTQTQHLCIL